MHPDCNIPGCARPFAHPGPCETRESVDSGAAASGADSGRVGGDPPRTSWEDMAQAQQARKPTCPTCGSDEPLLHDSPCYFADSADPFHDPARIVAEVQRQGTRCTRAEGHRGDHAADEPLPDWLPQCEEMSRDDETNSTSTISPDHITSLADLAEAVGSFEDHLPEAELAVIRLINAVAHSKPDWSSGP